MLDGKPVGAPVDVEMFSSSKWRMLSSSDTSHADEAEAAAAATVMLESCRDPSKKAEILRVFAFEHTLMRMSVIVRDLNTGIVHTFCKGSFESIKNLCDEECLPDRFDHVCEAHARNGTYTLGFAHRVLSQDEVDHLSDLTRDNVERGLSAAGLILFKNELKPDSHEAISKLKKAGVRPVMITGDNALTGICIAREVGMLHQKSSPVYLADVNEDGDVVWSNALTGAEVNVEEFISNHFESLESVASSSSSSSSQDSSSKDAGHDDKNEMSDNSHTRSYDTATNGGTTKASLAYTMDSSPSYVRKHLGFELAMTGAAFRALKDCEEMCSYLLLTRVFARMSPDDKTDCVQLHMAAGSIVSMCGDGGNDCGALRASHVGLALSDSDASIVSPFSSTDPSVLSFVELLRQGRGALASSFASFKFIIMYGECLVFAKIIMSYYGITLAENVWICMDSIVFVGLSWALSFAEPAPKLTHRRPTARLLGYETLSSVGSMIFVNLIFLIAILFWMSAQPWYICHEWVGTVDMRDWWAISDNL